MKLKDLKRSGAKESVYSGVVADVAGHSDYELSITGAREMVERMFEKVDVELDIDPKASKDEFESRSQTVWKRHARGRAPVPPPAARPIKDLIRKEPPAATPRNSVVVTLRRTKGEGTFWGVWLPRVFIPAGASLFLVLPRVWTCWGVVVPTFGNPNLFLSIGAPFAPPVSAAVAPGLTVEAVGFTGAPLPWTHFSAWFRVFGAAPTLTDVGIFGHSIP